MGLLLEAFCWLGGGGNEGAEGAEVVDVMTS